MTGQALSFHVANIGPRHVHSAHSYTFAIFVLLIDIKCLIKKYQSLQHAVGPFL